MPPIINVDALERELERTREAGLALLKRTAETAQAENREFTDEERAALKKFETDGLALKDRIARAKGDEAIFAGLNGLTAGITRTPAVPAANGRQGHPLSWGEQFVQSPAFEFFKQGRHRAQSAWASPSIELPWPSGYGGIPLLHGATLTEDPASGGSLVIPQYLPGIQPLMFKRLVVADLFAQGTTDSNTIVYMREKTFTNAAAPVGEGEEKPESTLIFESASDAVRKIAHWLPVSEEMLEDVAQIRSYIDARLRLGVLIEEEDQLLNGTGTAPELAGLLTRAGLGAPIAKGATENNADAIFRQMMALYASSFLMPDGVVMNPVNWAATALMKSSTGEYLTAGPFAAPQSPTLWGLSVAVTPSTVAGEAIVGAFKQAGQVFRKGGVRVEASNSHQDFFIKNLVAIRGEERLALAVYRPGAFGKVTALTGAPAAE